MREHRDHSGGGERIDVAAPLGKPGARTRTQDLPPSSSASSVLASPASHAVDDGSDGEAGAAKTGAGKGPGRLAAVAGGSVEKLNAIIATLLPGYRDAVDALDSKGAANLAANMLAVYQEADLVRDELRAFLEPSHPRYWQNYLLPLTPEQTAEREAARPMLGALDVAATIVVHQLAGGLGVQRFRGREVMRDMTGPIPLGRRAAERLAYEAAQTCEMIDLVNEVRELVPPVDDGGAARLDPDAGRAVAAKVALHARRPVSIAFLRTALEAEGRWSFVEHAIAPDGRTVAQLDKAATDQAEVSGAMANVGDFREDVALSLLPRTLNPAGYDVGDGSGAPIGATSANARKVWAMIMSADPEARPGIIVRLERLSVLSALLNNDALPFALAEQLNDSLPTGTPHGKEARRLLRPAFENKGGGRSLARRLRDMGPAGEALAFSQNVATLGFAGSYGDAYDAREAGQISGSEFETRQLSAMVKTGAIAGVTVATAGAAGAYAEGFIAELLAQRAATAGALGFAARTVPQVAGGAVEGAAGAVTARAAGDAVDLYATGGTSSSFGDYVDDAMLGGGLGGGAAVLFSGLGAGARYLPAAARTRLQNLALRFPRHEDFFAGLRRLGEDHGATVRISARKLYELGRDGIVPPGTAQRAIAEVTTSAGRRVGLDDPIVVTVESPLALNKPGDVVEGAAPIRVVRAERVAEDAVSEAGDDVSRAVDDVADLGDEFDAGAASRAEGSAVDDLAAFQAAARARAVEELEQLVERVMFAPKGSTLGDAAIQFDTYFVSHADGARMPELLRSIRSDVATRTYKKGLLVRKGAEEWYFEFNDQAAHLSGQRANAMTAADGIGLPAPNVATLELWGYRGARTIQRPGDPMPRERKTQWTPEEEAAARKAIEDEPLLEAGHVGVSFDGGETIYGLTPDYRGMPLEEVKRRLKNHDVFPGIVGNDTEVFRKASRMAREQGWNTEPIQATLLLDRLEQPRMFEEVQRMVNMKPGEHGMGYSWSLPKPGPDGQHFQGGTAVKGPPREFCSAMVRNCAAYPEKLGVPIPEPSGKMIEYMPELKKWADADAPIEARDAKARRP